MNCSVICVACRKCSAVSGCVYFQMSAASMHLKLSKIYHVKNYVLLLASMSVRSWKLVEHADAWYFNTQRKQGWKLQQLDQPSSCVTFGSDQWVFVLWLPPWHVTSQHLETLPSCKIHIWLMRRRKWLVNFNVCRSLPFLTGKNSFPTLLCCVLHLKHGFGNVFKPTHNLFGVVPASIEVGNSNIWMPASAATVALEPLKLVWAKCSGYPSYPALVSVCGRESMTVWLKSFHPEILLVSLHFGTHWDLISTLLSHMMKQ